MASIIELKDIRKTFGALVACDAVSMVFNSGEIVGIIGENGAGKSTIMNILYGYLKEDSGQILKHGEPIKMLSPADAIAQDIGMVHQHFVLIEAMSVYENIILGAEQGYFLQKVGVHAEQTIAELMSQYDLRVDLHAIVSDLSVGEQQRVEILKALYRNADILILDEPSAVLTPQEVEGLSKLMQKLKSNGKTVILITHKLKEILNYTDRVYIMRSGRVISERMVTDTNEQELITDMVGRELPPIEAAESTQGDRVLQVQNLSWVDSYKISKLNDVSFDLHRGEVLGVAGVSGNGQSTLLQLLSGMLQPSEGSMSVLGRTIDKTQHINPLILRQMGVAHLPEDRYLHGMVPDMSLMQNFFLGYTFEIDGIWFGREAIEAVTQKNTKSYDVRPQSPEALIHTLSGGNQQKLVFAREASRRPDIFLLGQPTRGVDVGAIEFIHQQILALKKQKIAILLVSVELDEIMTLSDRIIVMNSGSITGTLQRDQFDRNRIGALMSGKSSATERMPTDAVNA